MDTWKTPRPPPSSNLRGKADTQHAESSYPHAVALEDIVPVERWGVQRVNWRWILHRAGKRRRAGTQTLRDLFMRSKEAQGTGTRREGGQLAATNRSTQRTRAHTCSTVAHKKMGRVISRLKRCGRVAWPLPLPDTPRTQCSPHGEMLTHSSPPETREPQDPLEKGCVS